MASVNNIPSTVLFVGNEQDTTHAAYAFLKKLLCSTSCKGANEWCTPCRSIEEHQHYSVLWLKPEKQYTREQIEPIFNQIKFMRDSDEHYCIVITKAELLNHPCANSLLKSLEEPLPGYHFILTTDQVDILLPTIRSRCHVIYVEKKSSHATEYQSLLPLFTVIAIPSVATAMKTIDATKINEQEVGTLLAIITTHWHSILKKEVTKPNNNAARKQVEHILSVLTQALTKMPMPGSSKIFLRNLFLQMYFGMPKHTPQH